MIPEVFVTAWSVEHPWPLQAQVEQDLLLSRAICAIGRHPYLGEELIFRGGTALHKLHLDRPRRYSEDLDYVRRTDDGIGKLTRALTDLGKQLEFEVSTKIGTYPKVLWRGRAVDGSKLRIKIEVNTREREPLIEPVRLRHQVNSQWWTGEEDILTCHPVELMATKVRALYQRSKGRDLFDLWLALTALSLDPEQIMKAFAMYRPPGLTSTVAEKNLRSKVADAEFRGDLDPLVNAAPNAYDIDAAADLVIEELFRRL
ncbi:nucleotidyl transferase AbiEii/AbiGii toxin family protein [Phytoactinopolyspora endophytica]|uniref:nucleotidyl transferase AbiEii/AbiGii toxin family protein n=1 Tax=Phytoactinopolyspora endophytica TaxID=1642495 RepID=UPI00101D3F47|nr:nucleotidyl transferase AbiEii/AbiGii toxin family protein [Phytoactinopolyspora endophytica]